MIKFRKSDIIIFAIVVAIFAVSFFVFKPVVVRGPSMEPTFKDGDYRIVYTLKNKDDIRRGEIIVFRRDGTLLIKRIIGIEGDKIRTKGNYVVVNGGMLHEDYVKDKEVFYKEGDWEIPEGSFFVMGDNRAESYDSREDLGYVSEDEVIGTVITTKSAEITADY